MGQMDRGLILTLSEAPFILDGILEIPDLLSEPSSQWQSFQKSSNLLVPDQSLVEKHLEPLGEIHAELCAFDLSDRSLPELDSLSTSASEGGDITLKKESVRAEEISEDVWLSTDVIQGTKQTNLASWATFLNPQAERSRSAYLSEASPETFDAFLVAEASNRNVPLPKVVVQYDDLLRSLIELGSGRESLLYHYDNAQAKFVQTTEEFGLPAVSYGVLQDCVQEVMQMGTCVRRLEAFIAKQKSESLSIALSSAVSTILYAIKTSLQISSTTVKSILQLSQIFIRPKSLVQTLSDLVKSMKSTNNAGATWFNFMRESEKASSIHSWQEPVLHDLLRHSLAPWISAIESEAGLAFGSTVSETWASFLSKAGDLQAQSSSSRQDTSLVVIEELINESRRCLEILRDEQPGNPVFNRSDDGISRLSLQPSWEGISRMEMQANKYEEELQASILEFCCGIPKERELRKEGDDDDVLQCEDESTALMDLDSRNVLDGDLGGRSSVGSSLYQLTVAALSLDRAHLDHPPQSDLCPPLSQSVPLSLTPLLSAQSRLLSYSTLHLVFNAHSLRTHLNLQQRFQLLMDGPFASRLSRALFDPDQYTSEGRRTAEGTAGLRLQVRDSWPPASSELRLVLMGILSESFHVGAEAELSKEQDLLGNLSFAIRNLSADELERCRDVNSIEALDFLRLQYEAPPVLNKIISRSSLKKYDRIFKYMLRLLRMQAVVQTLVRDVAGRNGKTCKKTQKFRKEAHHFISALAAYSGSDAIGAPWSRFDRLIKDVEDSLARGDYAATLSNVGTASRLTQIHDELLDHILRALFLDRRQAQLREMIEDVFRLILRFFTLTRLQSHPVDDLVRNTHMEFRKQVGRIVRCLGNRVDESGSRQGRHIRDGRPPPSEHLLVKLNLFGYYTNGG